MQHDDPWAIDPVDQPGQAQKEAEPQARLASLEEVLLGLDYNVAPVFAVLDGAQFDNLPQELLLGNFVSRPLYLDRGDNNSEQIITAPHMVWLDERPEKVTGRAPRETIPALMALIASRPAAVFWQCPAGSGALYKHLRSINMVLYPRAAIADFENLASEEPQGAIAPETHTLVLFRHADSNVLAQTVPAMDPVEMARFYGPAVRLLFAPEPAWAKGRDWWCADRPENLPDTKRGHLMISRATVGRIDGIRLQHDRLRIAAYLRRVAPDQTRDMDDATLDALTKRYMNEAHSYGVSSEAAMGRWSFLQLLAGGRLSDQKEITDYIARNDGKKTADERVRDVIQMVIANARGS